MPNGHIHSQTIARSLRMSRHNLPRMPSGFESEGEHALLMSVLSISNPPLSLPIRPLQN